MKKAALGDSGLVVTEFCLGILPMGPLQAAVPPETCFRIIAGAYERGVNFFDTAEIYGTQPYLGEVFREERPNIVIATKSIAGTYNDMARSVERSLREMKTDYIDIYHLHAAREGEDVFSTRKGALDCLVKMKRQKVIRAAGIATHNPWAVSAAAERDDVDVVFALVNKKGLGVVGGSLDDMLRSIRKAAKKSKGIYAMKALGGGNLISDLTGAFNWVRDIEAISSVAVGVVSEDELRMDLSLFGLQDPAGEPARVSPGAKKLFVFKWICRGCASCVETCPNDALSIDNNIAVVDPGRCLLCGYCSAACPEFAIRVI